MSDSPMNDAILAGVPRLLDDLQKLLETHDHADILFLVGREETPFYAHRLLLNIRCKSATFLKRFVPPGSATQTVRLPHHKADSFRTALIYLYTGKVLLDDQNVFDVLGLCQDMNLEELKLFCEDHITLGLNVDNACSLLASALLKEESTSSFQKSNGSNPSFVEQCINFIGENASECFQTPGFLKLSKDAVIRLVSSDHLASEEVEIWRAVLNWARQQANVTQSNAQLWNEDERQRVCQALAGVINHVRLLLIDSQVFAEEVEPTGAVPMEVSLERYRLAALPAKFREQQHQQQQHQLLQRQQQQLLQHPSNQEDKRLQPRVPTKVFANSQILVRDRAPLQNILNQWYLSSTIGSRPNPNWKLVFRASQNDFSATEFHRICDGVSPLYILIQGPKGEVCGGFTDVPWAIPPVGSNPTHSLVNKGRYIASDKAFLFSLINVNGQMAPQKFEITKKTFAICYHVDCGPIFGAGADLLISDNCDANLDSYSNLPHSYDGEDASPDTLMGDYNFSVVEYEVYTLAQPK